MAQNLVVKARIEAEDNASSTIKRVDSSFAGLASTLKGFAVAGVAAAAAGLAGFIANLKAWTDAAAQAEQASIKLENAIGQRFGDAARGAAKEIEALASALQAKTGEDDDAIKSGAALAASFVRTTDDLKRVTSAAVDLKAGIGVDLQTAFQLLAKAAEGNTAALSRYGLTVDETVPKAQKLEVLLGLIETRLGGRAQKDAESFAGSLRRVAANMGDLAETAGNAVVKNEEIRKGLVDLNDVLTSQGLNAAVEELSLLVVALGQNLANVGIASFTSELKGGGNELQNFANLFAQLRGATDLLGAAFEARAQFNRGEFAESWRTLSGAIRDHNEELRLLNNEYAFALPVVNSLASGLSAVGAALMPLAGSLRDTANAAKEVKTEFELADEAAKRLGQVTSAQLANELIQVQIALLSQKEVLGANSAEYIRLEQIAGEKIELLKERIRSLQAGLGDLASTTEDAADRTVTALGYIGSAADTAARSFEFLATTQNAATESLTRLNGAQYGGDSPSGSFDLAIGERVANPAFRTVAGGRFTASTLGSAGIIVTPDGRIISSLGNNRGFISGV